MNNLAYQYHISGAVKSAVAYVLDNATSGSNGGSSGGDLNESTTAANSVPKVLYSEALYYEDCDSEGCTPQYNGNISRMVHHLAHINQFFSTERDVAYYYDELNRLTKVDDKNERDFYDEAFTYDAQGRITSQRRDGYVNNATKVVVNLPQGLGRYDIASASESSANTVPSFEWYLKNHLGSTMLVYGTQSISDPTVANLGSLKAAYDYRAFGEQVDLTMPTDKVTETFTGKEKDDETELSYFGARYLDQMLGMWVSVDAKRQFNSPYLYAGNGTNPVNGVDGDGNELDENGNAIYTNLDNNYFFGSDILRNDWTEMKNSKDLINVVFEKGLDYATNDKASNTIFFPKSLDMHKEGDLKKLGVLGRHEGAHLKGEAKANWHFAPDLFFNTDIYTEILEINNTIYKGMKSGANIGVEYDPIYQRDYEAYQEMNNEKKH